MAICFARVISCPPGEAPENVREAWVGLVLPVEGLHEDLVYGVLSDQVSNSICKGYRVTWNDAMTALGRKNVSARAWWITHVSPRTLIFPAECMELIAD